MARLENWKVITRPDPYQAPETWPTVLSGEVYGHNNQQRHPNGKKIITSRILGVRDGVVVTSTGSKYELGTVDAEYDKEYPNAKERVLETLKNI